MDLGEFILNKELLDKHGRRCGKVDDLMLEMPDPDRPREDERVGYPEVVAILAGPLALSRSFPGPLRWLARTIYRLVGLKDPQTVELPWRDVRLLDVVVHLDVDRDAVGLMAAHDAARRIVTHLPRA